MLRANQNTVKPTPLFAPLALLVGALSANAQGTVLFHQQTSTDEFSPPCGYGTTVRGWTNPCGQSFTPTLSRVDFIRLISDDGNPNDGRGATVYLTLRSGAIDGPIIGTTASVTMANGFSGVSTFIFPIAVPMVPNTTYFFNPVVQDYSDWYILASLGP